MLLVSFFSSLILFLFLSLLSSALFLPGIFLPWFIRTTKTFLSATLAFLVEKIFSTYWTKKKPDGCAHDCLWRLHELFVEVKMKSSWLPVNWNFVDSSIENLGRFSVAPIKLSFRIWSWAETRRQAPLGIRMRSRNANLVWKGNRIIRRIWNTSGIWQKKSDLPVRERASSRRCAKKEWRSSAVPTGTIWKIFFTSLDWESTKAKQEARTSDKRCCVKNCWIWNDLGRCSSSSSRLSRAPVLVPKYSLLTRWHEFVYSRNSRRSTTR